MMGGGVRGARGANLCAVAPGWASRRHTKRKAMRAAEAVRARIQSWVSAVGFKVLGSAVVVMLAASLGEPSGASGWSLIRAQVGWRRMGADPDARRTACCEAGGHGRDHA
jgi:hypothetical protein